RPWQLSEAASSKAAVLHRKIAAMIVAQTMSNKYNQTVRTRYRSQPPKEDVAGPLAWPPPASPRLSDAHAPAHRQDDPCRNGAGIEPTEPERCLERFDFPTHASCCRSRPNRL